MTDLRTEKTALQTDLVLPYLARPALTEAKNRKAIILLHGVGSNEADLFSLAPLLPDNYVVISSRGPVSLGIGRYAWYEVDFSTGKPAINAKQEEQSRSIILEYIEQVKQKYNLSEVYLGGFSQGAIMSYSIGLINPAIVAGVVALSGRILTEIRPLVIKVDNLKKLKVFVAHGTQDSTLPVHYAREAKTYLEQLKTDLAYHEFEISHQIDQQVLTELVKWLN